MFYTSDFDYRLPSKLIAQQPMKPRDHSRLLILDKNTGEIEHKHFYDIVNYLNDGDVLVLNNSKVFPARLIGQKKDTGGKIEVFLHQKIKAGIWNCLLGGHGKKDDLEIKLGKGRFNLIAKVLKDNQDGTWQVKFNKTGQSFFNVVNKIGKTPLPPYIKRNKKLVVSSQKDKINYQTVYADEKKTGSVAAPTAGFHFTPPLLNKLKKRGIQIEYVTLHVGLGTFAPVKIEKIKDHKMHSELVEISKKTLANVIKAKKEKRRIIAVGTTSIRTLESAFTTVILESRILGTIESRRDPISRSFNAPSMMTNHSFQTSIFIYPPYKFKVIDAVITNFHLPKSTLLMLVSAFAGKKNIDRAYQEAIKNKYRFFSYGDAMFIN